MLVLSRRAGETIQIGNDVVLKITALSRGRVRVGIEAPPELAIKRGELADFETSTAAPPKSARRRQLVEA